MTFTTRVELSQLHDIFRAFLADFRYRKTRDLQTDGRTDEPSCGDAYCVQTHLKICRRLNEIALYTVKRPFLLSFFVLQRQRSGRAKKLPIKLIRSNWVVSPGSDNSSS